MKISVSTYSFSNLMNAGKMTQLDCFAKAKEMGFDAVEVEGLHHGEDITDLEYAARLYEASQKSGMPISNFVFGADLIGGSEGDTAKEISRVKELLNCGAAMKVGLIRHDCTFTQPTRNGRALSFDTVLPQLADACREITVYAQTLGIRTMVENHGTFAQDSDRVEKLINTVAHENFGLLADMGNFLCADENPAAAFGRVAPYAFYAHAKDFYVKSPCEPNPGRGFFQSRSGAYLRGAVVGHGDVPVKHCLAALKRVGFDGTIALEFEGVEDPLFALSVGLENLRRYWDEL